MRGGVGDIRVSRRVMRPRGSPAASGEWEMGVLINGEGATRHGEYVPVDKSRTAGGAQLRAKSVASRTLIATHTERSQRAGGKSEFEVLAQLASPPRGRVLVPGATKRPALSPGSYTTKDAKGFSQMMKIERVERERMRGCEEEKRRSATKSKRTLTTRWAVGTVMLSGVPHSEHTLAACALRAPYSERFRHDPLSLAFWVGGAESICSHTRTCHPAPPHII